MVYRNGRIARSLISLKNERSTSVKAFLVECVGKHHGMKKICSFQNFIQDSRADKILSLGFFCAREKWWINITHVKNFWEFCRCWLWRKHFCLFFFPFVISLLWNKTGTLSCSNGSYRCQVVESRLVLYSGLWWSLSIRLSLKCLWWLKGHFSPGFFVVKSSYLGYLSTKKAR